MQFATPCSVRADGKKVFLTTEGKFVCPHGECSSTICYWLREERKAKEAGEPLPPRGGCRGLSTCDCQNTDGLNSKITDSDGAHQPATRPPSLFEYLETQGAEMILVKGREARRVPHLCGPTFVTSTGKLCCRHGATRFSLVHKKKAGNRPSCRLPACGCELKSLPVRRGGLAGMQLGKYAKENLERARLQARVA